MKYFRTLVIGLLLVSASAAVQAQDRTLAKANVPFSFTVENVTLPAGIYRVTTLSPYTSIRIESADGRHVVMVPTIVAQHLQDADQVKLVFQRVGGEYFLAQIWEQSSNEHRELRISKRAVELAKAADATQRAKVATKPVIAPGS